MAMPSNEFSLYCCDLLSAAGPCVARRMFGGYGISTDGLTLALLVDLGAGEKLWLKASDTSQALFEAAGCERFVYRAKGKLMSVNYYSAPDDAMESAPLMAPWARLALEAALKARQSKLAPRRAAKARVPGKPQARVKTAQKSP